MATARPIGVMITTKPKSAPAPRPPANEPTALLYPSRQRHLHTDSVEREYFTLAPYRHQVGRGSPRGCGPQRAPRPGDWVYSGFVPSVNGLQTEISAGSLQMIHPEGRTDRQYPEVW